MDVAPALPLPREEVAKASQGHDPLPFLISELKNWHKGNGAETDFPNFYERCNKEKAAKALLMAAFEVVIFFPALCLRGGRLYTHPHHPCSQEVSSHDGN